MSKARQLEVCALGANNCCLARETCGNALTWLGPPSGRWAPVEAQSLFLCCRDAAASGRVEWWRWQPQRGRCSGSPKERHTGCQGVRPESPWHGCFQLPSVCHSMLQVKQALEQKDNVPSGCKCNCCSVEILSGENHLTDTSDRATSSLMTKARLRQTVRKQTKLKCTLSTVYMFVQ